MSEKLDTEYWFVSVPESARNNNQVAYKISKYASCDQFFLPELRIGTLDTLVSINDQLAKDDSYVSGVNLKIIKQWYDLYLEDIQGEKRDVTLDDFLLVGKANVDAWIRKFKWDTGRWDYEKDSLKKITESINKNMKEIEEQLRLMQQEWSQINNAISSAEKNSEGSLLIRDLSGVVEQRHIHDSDTLTTLLIVVSRNRMEEWLSCYERLVALYPNENENEKERQRQDPQYCVLPRSSSLIIQDNDEALVTVVLFKKHVDLYRKEVINKKFQVRDFKFEKGSAAAKEKKIEELKEKRGKLKIDLFNFSQTQFSEAFSSWIHMKSIRLWVESVLRYGLPAKFTVFLIKPISHKVELKLRQTFNELYSDLGGDVYADDIKGNTDEGLSAFGLSNEKLYSYVFLDVHLHI